MRIVEICPPNRIRVEALGTVAATWIAVDDPQPYVADVVDQQVRSA